MPEQPAGMRLVEAGQLSGVLLRDLSAFLIVHATPPVAAGTGPHQPTLIHMAGPPGPFSMTTIVPAGACDTTSITVLRRARSARSL